MTPGRAVYAGMFSLAGLRTRNLAAGRRMRAFFGEIAA
jgi:hypothetical protein